MNNQTEKLLAYSGFVSTDLINFKDGNVTRSSFDQQDRLIGPLRGIS